MIFSEHIHTDCGWNLATEEGLDTLLSELWTTRITDPWRHNSCRSKYTEESVAAVMEEQTLGQEGRHTPDIKTDGLFHKYDMT